MPPASAASSASGAPSTGRSRPQLRRVGTVLLIASIAAMAVAGLWASRLGPPPSWAFDCSETSCIDLWSTARTHYLRIAVGGALTSTIGWLLIGLGASTAARPGTVGPGGAAGAPGAGLEPGAVAPAERRILVRARRAGRTLLLALPSSAVIAALLAVAMRSAIVVSRPFAVAAAIAVLTFAGWWLRRRLRPVSRSDAIGTLGAGGVLVLAGLPLLTGAVIIPPTGSAMVLLLILVPQLSIPAGAAALAVASTIVHEVLKADARASAPTVSDPGPPSAPSDPFAAPVLRRTTFVVIAAAAVLAALPIPAPPSDARPEAEAPAVVDVPEDQASSTPADGTDPAIQPPSAASPEDDAGPSASALDPAGLPACRADDLALTVAGWDRAVGDGYAELRATNTGAAPCALVGAPQLRLEQGGEEIALDQRSDAPESADDAEAGGAERETGTDGIGLRPGDTAASSLHWPGYGAAADQTTPQTLSLRLDPSDGSIASGDSASDDDVWEPIPFDTGSGDDPLGTGPGPAPFDLRAGIDGGAEIEVGSWRAR
ncbi:DUF4232 domain-containing protein [Brachybacterium sp. DNPG3]